MSYPVTITAEAAAAPLLFWSTVFDAQAWAGDWRVAPLGAASNAGGIDNSRPLQSAVTLSLFTDRRAPEGWRPEIADRRGWWGDSVAAAGASPVVTGSHLWLLRNEVASAQNAELAKIYAEEALAWMVESKVAASVTVTSGLVEDPRRGVWLEIVIRDRDGVKTYDQRFAGLWQQETRA